MAKRGVSISNWNWKTDGVAAFQRELMSPAVYGRIHKAVVDTFVSAQNSFLDSLPAHEAPYMPFVTGNLHDSIAAVVSEKGRVLHASYTEPAAITTSEVTGKDIFVRSNAFPTLVKGKRIIGSQEAAKAVRNMQGVYPEAISSTLLIAAPYAETPQEKGPHAGYMDILASKYSHSMENAFRAGQSLGLWTWKGGYNMPTARIEQIIRTSQR